MTPQPNAHPHQPSRNIPLILFAPVVIVLLLPVILLGLALYWLYGRWLKARWDLTWGRRGKRVLLVYSRSPSASANMVGRPACARAEYALFSWVAEIARDAV